MEGLQTVKCGVPIIAENCQRTQRVLLLYFHCRDTVPVSPTCEHNPGSHEDTKARRKKTFI